MAKFVYFKNDCAIRYSVGQHFSLGNFNYIREAAYSINKVFPTGKLILVVKGHSGSILAGGIAYILKRKDRDVLISVSLQDYYVDSCNHMQREDAKDVCFKLVEEQYE